MNTKEFDYPYFGQHPWYAILLQDKFLSCFSDESYYLSVFGEKYEIFKTITVFVFKSQSNYLKMVNPPLSYPKEKHCWILYATKFSMIPWIKRNGNIYGNLWFYSLHMADVHSIAILELSDLLTWIILVSIGLIYSWRLTDTIGLLKSGMIRIMLLQLYRGTRQRKAVNIYEYYAE